MPQPMLDDLALPLVQTITTQDRRALSELKPPGMAGSLLQNLGRQPLRIVVSGVATGTDALAAVQKLDDKFRAGDPLPFVADIVKDADLQQVLIEDLIVTDLAGKPDRRAYVLTLREFIKPVDPAPAATSDSDILGDAADRLNGVVDNIAKIQALATGLEPWITKLTGLLQKVQAAGK